MGSFALPAWAVNASEKFTEYAPLSWVIAGFAGMLIASVAYAFSAWARGKWVKSGYDRNLYERSGFVDPMASTFENKRIFLADFVLPSDQYMAGKTFINCEIVGPANLFMVNGYHVYEHRKPHVDAVVLTIGAAFFNGIMVDNCTFRGCSFKRITLMMLPYEYERHSELEWLNFISRPEDKQGELGLTPPQRLSAPELPQGTGEERPQ